MKCPQCKLENPEGKNFCSDCGALLTPQLLPLIRAQVEEYVLEHFKDQRIVELETADAVSGRVVSWAKLYYAFPAAVLVIVLALFGISDYSDFHKTVQRATNELKPKLEHAITEADGATKKAQEAEVRADAASKTIETAMGRVNAQMSSAQQLSAKVSGLESQTSQHIAETSKHIEDRLSNLDKRLEDANKTIVEQQAKLTSTNELVTAMFSKSQVEDFPTTQGNTDTIIVYPVSPATQNLQKGAIVYMLLKSAPIYQTVQIGFYIYIQPRHSYNVNGNVLMFFWGDPAESLKQHPLEVSYVPDPTYKGTIYSKLSLKDNHIFADSVRVF